MMITNGIGTADVRAGDTSWRRDVSGATLSMRGREVRAVSPATGRMVAGPAPMFIRPDFHRADVYQAKQARPPRGVPR